MLRFFLLVGFIAGTLGLEKSVCTEMLDQNLCSPPKVRRVVHMSPSGVVCSSTELCHTKQRNVGMGCTVPCTLQVSTPLQSQDMSDDKSMCQMLQPIPPSTSISAIEDTALHRQPPFLTIDSKNTSSLEMEGVLVEQALEKVMSLPQVVDEVRQNQRGQSSEIQKQQQFVKQLQEKLKEVKDRNEDLLQEISVVNNSIHLADQLAKNKSKSYKECEKDVRKLVTVSENLRLEVKNRSEELAEEKQMWEKYRTKMKIHQNLVEEYESSSEIFKEFREQEDEVNNLKVQYKEMKRDPEQMNRIVTGEVEKKLQLEINNIKEEKSVINNRLTEKINQITEIKDSQIKMEQTIKVLHKRNAAQLTRLKRQLKETQLRNRHWNDQVAQLERSILQAKQNLEE